MKAYRLQWTLRGINYLPIPVSDKRSSASSCFDRDPCPHFGRVLADRLGNERRGSMHIPGYIASASSCWMSLQSVIADVMLRVNVEKLWLY